MPIGRIVKETLGTLAEEVAKETAEAVPKRAPRKAPKTLMEVPEEIKGLPTEERAKAAGEFFKEEKDFIPIRQEDIVKDTKATFAKKRKVDEQVIEQDEILKKTEAPEDIDRMEMLKERQRNLYLKADNLEKEQILTQQIQKVKSEGGSTLDSLLNLFSNTPGVGKTFSNIEARTKAIYNRVNADMFDVKEGLRTKWLGMSQDRELAHEVLRYLKDGTVRNSKRLNEAKLIGDQWKKGAEKIKGLRNRAGARIGKLEDWIVPQSHDSRKIQKAGYEAWANKIRDKLDKSRIEAQQGKALEDVLEAAYKNIIGREERARAGSTSVIAKRGEESRVLHFKTADDMIDYSNEFGNPDIFATMDAHMMQQSNEIATMQLFGSNPDEMLRKLKDAAETEGDRLGSLAEGHLDRVWRLATGQADGDDIVTKADSALSAISGTHRSLRVAGSLGTATISSLADLGNIILGSGYRGLNSVNIIGRGLGTLIQEATTIGKVGKNIELANRIGVVSEFASASLANSRYAEVGTGAAQKAAEIVIRASGLASYTNSLRSAFGLELSANLAENFSKSYDKIPFKRMLEEYGIGAEEWAKISKSKPHEIKKAKFLDVNKLYEIDEDLGYRVNEMISNEMDAFVVNPSDRTRAWTTGGHKKGTLKGELARNVMLFKSFPIAITMVHMKRIGQIDSNMGKVAYGASTLFVSTVMGGMTLMAYDIATGKTPRDIDRPEFVLESVLKSGGLGIFGDMVLGGDKDRYGHSYTATLIGVPAGTIEDVAKTAYATITAPTEAKTWSDNFNRAKNYIPGQNLWYTRAVVEATIGDAIRKQIDPNYHRNMNRRAKYMRQRGQEFLLK